MKAGQLFRWWRAPIWVAALATGSKSFVDNPLLGSKRLNEAGLHRRRLELAHRLAWARRRRLANAVEPSWREQFDRNGFVAIPNFLPPQDFQRLRDALLERTWPTREHQQGDTITRRVAIGPEMLAAVPELAALLRDPRWKGLLSYVASTSGEPLYYVQTIAAGVADGPPDPQLHLHSDTFHPSLKAWLFLTDVPEDGRPLTYVPGSHLLTRERADWEQRRSAAIGKADRLSQRGSLRIAPEELAELDLPPPVSFAVPANTLVAADTYGFHARADSDRPTLRVEIWAYSRRTPFLPWTGLSPTSVGSIALRRAEWYGRIVDALDRRGWTKQHWRKAGARRPIDP
ncbi:phytanoyl-CoA dioxygenase family protein [Sphingomonas piscis]|uniref:Phytanoyl-CoA dioxygenase family protein n=1 Tax=Sphingomonas piscis TaxID=2714943 RepID=A0A6G7YSZ0_9SPHN|nr:phytanoyl-CoA dioxygenase family protein [Sphingomonas piscis]